MADIDTWPSSATRLLPPSPRSSGSSLNTCSAGLRASHAWRYREPRLLSRLWRIMQANALFLAQSGRAICACKRIRKRFFRRPNDCSTMIRVDDWMKLNSSFSAVAVDG
ncbi:hypothetical protein PGTUg99_023493 [Puccinia graminis f. sp. tritici]|uniref:Uncharacterized protein n=1 Tax=Puccinia graminis f. sp. tritici TaxID=56615 RepID=A0A5B0N0S0_PUCGR|nr:hypothetical protein PGTUg99_023493 [Puccinia graminis f. sp. tritici]